MEGLGSNEQGPNSEKQPTFPEIASEIAAMHEVDQDMRRRSVEEDFWDDEIDARHTARMKEIIAQIGWPTVSKVGVEGSENAWLLVQHADDDVEFQRECLALMEKEPLTEVSRRNVAMLTDRIRVNSSQGQVYGTQFTQIEGKHVPQPIEDPEHVDERRASMGLGTLAEGIQHMYDKYGVPELDEDA